MPLLVIEASSAWGGLSKNKFSAWPSKKRGGGERLSPIARPAFSSLCRLSNEDSVFAIGSCFARNIEEALSDMGVNVITNKFSVPGSEWDGRSNGILNKYHPFAMLNELSWALEEGNSYPSETGFMQLDDNQWLDLHLPGVAKPVGYDRAMARRIEIDGLYKKIKGCNLVMLTPGLVEAWWDNEAGYYTNQTIPRKLASKYAGRFELHVLSYDEVYSALNSLVNLLNKHCQPKVRIFMTVSPVPLAATFTMKDALIANTYSKSVLRAAVEQLVSENSNVEYFPSYEAIVLSDLSEAYGDDYIHVKDEAVRENIFRFVSALNYDLNGADTGVNSKRSHSYKRETTPVRGMVSETISNSLITGWAMDRNSDLPVTVKLYVDEQEVGACCCDEMRRVLFERSVHPTGHCGFSFKLKEKLKGGESIRVVEVKTGKDLLNSPFVYRYT